MQQSSKIFIHIVKLNLNLFVDNNFKIESDDNKIHLNKQNKFTLN